MTANLRSLLARIDGSLTTKRRTTVTLSREEWAALRVAVQPGEPVAWPLYAHGVLPADNVRPDYFGLWPDAVSAGEFVRRLTEDATPGGPFRAVALYALPTVETPAVLRAKLICGNCGSGSDAVTALYCNHCGTLLPKKASDVPSDIDLLQAASELHQRLELGQVELDADAKRALYRHLTRLWHK
jgi:hypothetical protein